MDKKKETFLIRFAKSILRALKIREIRLYGSKYSKKTYTLHQHIVLLAIREFHKGIGFRLLCELLPDYSLLMKFLGISTIPNFTTLHKVSQRLAGGLVEGIFLGFARRAKFRSGIDSTGLSLQHSTYYYEQRIEQFRKTKKRKLGRPRKRRKKKHQNTSLFADLDGRMILSTKLLRGKKSDNKMMIPTINEAMNATDHIKLRNKDVPVRRTKGTHRKRAKRLIQGCISTRPCRTTVSN